jgi:arylsulfatase A-like enzyme
MSDTEARNLLFIYTDEQAFNTLATYGNTKISMPNLDRLANRSFVCERAYVTQAVCTPSRSSLLTGQWPHTNGCTRNNVPLSADTRCVPEMCDSRDYRTAHIGKWHLGDEVFAQHGFEHWVSIEDNYTKYYSNDRPRDVKSSYHHFLIENGFTPESGSTFSRAEAARLPEPYVKAAFVGQRTCDFLDSVGDAPFICYVNFLEPHMPYFGPRDDQYEPETIDLPRSFYEPDPDAPAKVRAYRAAYRRGGHSGLPLETEADWKRLVANYWGLCSLIDTHVGRIIDALERNGQADDTLVVFTSDHGDMMGAQRMTAKTVQYEPSVRVPLLLRFPGQERQIRVRGAFSHIDVVPTILEALGEDRDPQIQGTSRYTEFRESLRTGEAFAVGEDAFIEWNGSDGGAVKDSRGEVRVPEELASEMTPEQLRRSFTDPVRTVITPDGWKLNQSNLPGDEDESQLFDLNADPDEIDNLYHDPAQADRVRELSERIAAWRERSGDMQ